MVLFQQFQCSQVLKRLVLHKLVDGRNRLSILPGIDQKSVSRRESVNRAGFGVWINQLFGKLTVPEVVSPM